MEAPASERIFRLLNRAAERRSSFEFSIIVFLSCGNSLKSGLCTKAYGLPTHQTLDAQTRRIARHASTAQKTKNEYIPTFTLTQEIMQFTHDEASKQNRVHKIPETQRSIALVSPAIITLRQGRCCRKYIPYFVNFSINLRHLRTGCSIYYATVLRHRYI